MRSVLIVPTAEAKAAASACDLFIRIATLSDDRSAGDLEAAMSLRPLGVFLEQAGGGEDIARLAARLAVAEARFGVEDGRTAILASTGHDGASLLSLASFRSASRRLAGLAFDARGLAGSLGVPVDSEPVRTGRILVLYAARAAGVAALGGPFQGLGASLEREIEAAQDFGYDGAIATGESEARAIASSRPPAAGT